MQKRKRKEKTIFSVWGENGSIDEYNRQSLKEEKRRRGVLWLMAARCVRDPRRDCRPTKNIRKKKKRDVHSFVCVVLPQRSSRAQHTCDYVSYLSGFVNKK
jgi:hypothetical protein